MKGFFIAFEGIDGSGKTLQTSLLSSSLRADGWAVTDVREPGGTRVGEQIRNVLIDCSKYSDPVTQLLLFFAARQQLLESVIRPALTRGDIVIADRFVASTWAYQMAGVACSLSLTGFDRSQALGRLENVLELATKLIVQDTRPNLTIHLSLAVHAAQARLRQEGRGQEHYERPDFQEAVVANYAQYLIGGDYKLSQRVVVVDAEKSPEDLAEEIKQIVDKYLPLRRGV